MDRGRLDLQLQRFGKALAALEEAVATDTGDKKSRDSILLSYVFTFEMAWRGLQFALALRGLRAPDYAAAVLRAGVQGALLDDPDGWDRMREYRNDVSHAYDEPKAIAIAAFVRAEAVARFRRLLERLQRDD